MTFRFINLKSIRLCAVVLSAALFAGFSANGAEYDVYILAGQSNMDGRGEVEKLPEAMRSEQRGVLIYYTHPADPAKQGEQPTHSDAWQTLEPGYSVPTRSRRVDLPSATFGPEVSFAYAMQKKSAKPRPIAIIKISRGGTNLRNNWSPEGYMYTAMVAEVGKAMQALKDHGHEGVLRGVLWHQGESDTRDPKQYQSNLQTLIANTRKALGVEAMPFLIGELADTKPEAFRAMQQAIARDNEGVFFVSAKGLKTKDNTHFNAESQVELGQRFAEVMQGVLKGSTQSKD